MLALFRLPRAVFSQISKRYVAHLTVDLGSETTLNKSIYGLSRIPSTSFHSSSCMFNVLAIKVPAFPESITEGDVNWKKSIGDNVLADEIIAEIETDKTTLPVMSPCSGIITEFLVEDGSRVIYNQEIGKVDEQEVSAKKPEIKEPIKHSVVPEKPKATVVKTLPSTPAESQKKTSQPPPIVNLPEVTQKPFRSEQRVKLTRIRLRTAERLKEAQNTCAILTTFQEVDMSNLVELRNQFKDAFFKKHGIKLGLMSTFGKASAYALKDQPIVNAYIDESDVVYRHYVDISIAVASPKGLVVPVLRNVEGMNFAQIERGIFELGEKAKSGSLAVEDMDGGTFTISNGGIFGSLLSTPIVNPPQSAILGLHGTFDRPVARDGQVVIRPMMYIALSYDHRLIDGREAVLFLRKIKSFVEDPRVFFLDI